MRVLLAHDYYRSSAPSGEDAVFRNERDLLLTNGIDVVPYECFNDDIDDKSLGKRLRLALNTAWSRDTYTALSALIRETKPDVAHFHNTFPIISPSAYAACQDHGVPVVQTLHNYRLVCPGALLIRNGAPCEECLEGSLRPALRHRCYRASLPATGTLVWMLASNRYRGTYRNLVNRYVALTRFAAKRLIAGGLPEARMEIKPNFLPNMPDVDLAKQDYAIYVGRLSAEKGVRTLLRAWEDVKGFPLKIVGDGSLRNELERYAGDHRLAVEFLGFRTREDVLRLVGGAMLQIVPSEWYEGFPMVVLEAYACGTPVIASGIGSLDEVVMEGETGVKFMPGDAQGLAAAVNRLRTDPDSVAQMGSNACAMFHERYSAERNFVELMGIYERAMTDFGLTRRTLSRHVS